MSNYQVMLGVPSAELEDALTARFEELTDADLVSTHWSSREVSETVGKIQGLDVVLIHESLGPLPVLDLIRDISGNHPQLAVILVVDEVESDTFTNAMEAGARSVLPANATIEQISARVSTAAEWSRTLRRHLEAASLDVPMTGRHASIVSFTGSKGGVGTTTTVIHLARLTAKAGRRVCLVDLDLQMGDVPGYFDLKHRRSIVDLVEAADDISASMLADALYVHPDGLHILLAPDHGERGEDVTGSATRKILGALRSRYDLVVVDCGSTMTEATAMAVELSDTAVVLTNPDLPALRSAQRIIAMWERLQIRESTNVTGLLMRHSRKNEIQPDFARKLLGITMLRTTVPAAYRAVEAASNTGSPDRLTDESLLKAYGQLAGELEMFASSEKTDEKETGGEASWLDAAKPATPAKGLRRLTRKGDSGAGIVEFALVTPFLCIAGLLVLQILLIGLGGMYATHAANEGARQAAVTPNDYDAIVEESTKRIIGPWDDEENFSLELVNQHGAVYVNVTIETPAVIPWAPTPDTWDVSGSARVLDER
ncbi:AAA family ATPase [Halostreptopolyspora alba]|uniref:Septum formation initiator n=1 Tax=Halostreptopolyspora alba TaxID=2487137 RepID=A0A3N0E6K5_9ACTN|nr:septum formation initiator [Nocardiopsaceae bacterium YIM 96095]